ncbi:4'-phosphopantetheinyl transferase superfamily protein [Streptomyces sp. AM 4-1-1]|uniref:4'-phosphopantetheinyl transferase family protein n=1 Tax=Streptomyces sp. AM 4-1-1 TaxID=3028710 RepID=UPI0023B957D4|nr:4'-phosphopantetheinyl transferase superfamily protein [Streptomyces sp. AM 4-1-1]WEH37234.1 4'-phosphopantetheinyl transferase superfamily protein [Streptomyces sp. AM 4-1-1]
MTQTPRPAPIPVPTPLRVDRGVWIIHGPQQYWQPYRSWSRPQEDPQDVPAGPRREGRHGTGDRRRLAEHRAGRAALRTLLLHVRAELAALPVIREATGRPALEGRPDVSVSISHDGGAVAAAVSWSGPVGIDIQQPYSPASETMLRRCLHDYAAEVLTAPPAHRARELAWVWSAQEACVKAAGSGLAGRPWTIDVPPYSTHGRWGGYRWTSLREASETPLSWAFLPSPHSGPPTCDHNTAHRDASARIRPADDLNPTAPPHPTAPSGPATSADLRKA